MENSDERIEIENIRDYVVTLLAEINEFLEKYGKYHLQQFINAKQETFHPCLFPNPEGKGFLVGGRLILFSEYKNVNP